jgi:uridine phosphorylase
VPQRPVEPIHLRPTAELAERVLLPGDPHRALAVAQALLDTPRMFNHARGLWGYTGTAADGELLTVQSTGMGGPSAAIVIEEVVALGARRLVRIGTCGALSRDLSLGDLLAATEVVPADGTSAALGAVGALRPDAALTNALLAAGARPATVVSTDLFYYPREDGDAPPGADAIEMEAAALLQVASLRGAAAACLLAVTDVPEEDGMRRIDPAELDALGVRLGEVGWAAFSGTGR